MVKHTLLAFALFFAAPSLLGVKGETLPSIVLTNVHANTRIVMDVGVGGEMTHAHLHRPIG